MHCGDGEALGGWRVERVVREVEMEVSGTGGEEKVRGHGITQRRRSMTISHSTPPNRDSFTICTYLVHTSTWYHLCLFFFLIARRQVRMDMNPIPTLHTELSSMIMTDLIARFLSQLHTSILPSSLPQSP